MGHGDHVLVDAGAFGFLVLDHLVDAIYGVALRGRGVVDDGGAGVDGALVDRLPPVPWSVKQAPTVVRAAARARAGTRGADAARGSHGSSRRLSSCCC